MQLTVTYCIFSWRKKVKQAFSNTSDQLIYSFKRWRNHLICSRLLLHLHNRKMNLRSLQAVWNLDITPVWVTVRSGVEVDGLWPCRRCSKSSVKSLDLKTTIRPVSCFTEFNSIPVFLTLKCTQNVIKRSDQAELHLLAESHTYAAHFMVLVKYNKTL